MYAYVSGKLVEHSETEAIVDVLGVGWRLSIPANCLGVLPTIGEEVLFYTTFVVREQSQELYGFLSRQERDLFEALTQTSGVGPKLALSVIGHLSVNELQGALSEGDVTTLSKVPGIGKKTAQRLLIEMKDRLPKISSFDPSALSITLPQDPRSKTTQDAMNALIHLGYSQMKAKQAIHQCLPSGDEEIELESLIKQALKHV